MSNLSLNSTLARAWIDKCKITLGNSYEDICSYRNWPSTVIEYLKSFPPLLVSDWSESTVYSKSINWGYCTLNFKIDKGFISWYAIRKLLKDLALLNLKCTVKDRETVAHSPGLSLRPCPNGNTRPCRLVELTRFNLRLPSVFLIAPHL